MQFLPSRGHVDTAMWIITKCMEEKLDRKIPKNAASNTEQVLEAAAEKPPITKTIQVKRTRHAGHC